MNYYNEFDQFAAAWLRELIKEGLIPQGDVDERSITEVLPADLKGYTQCHFFAGIGGWSEALRLAGWSSDRPVWTGSPPCQPFSSAGNRKGQSDERHLWPVFFNLIRECAPSAVFGEQVASAIRTSWFDDLQADMEREGYATAMAVLPACGVGAPHKRDRLFYVAHRCVAYSDSVGLSERSSQVDGGRPKGEQGGSPVRDFTGDCGQPSVTLADTDDERLQGHGRPVQVERQEGRQIEVGHGSTANPGTNPLADPDSERLNGIDPLLRGNQSRRDTQDSLQTHWGSQEHRSAVGDSQYNGQHESEVGRGFTEASDDYAQRQDLSEQSSGAGRPTQSGDLCHWSDTYGVYCADKKVRPIPTESEVFPLAHGISNRVGLLRGAGNAIVPQVAAEVVKAYMATY